MNKAKLLKLLRKQGFDGTATLENVKAFISENGIEFQDSDGDAINVDKVWHKTVTITVAADAGEDVQVVDGGQPEGESAKMDEEDEEEAPMGASARSVRREVGSKRVNGVHASMNTSSAAVFNHRLDRKRYERKIREGKAAFSDADQAASWGAWVRLAAAGANSYPQKAADLDIIGKAQVTYDNSLGGALVPDDFVADLIDIREDYGALEGVVATKNMSRDTQTFPRGTGNLTVYSPGEATAITASTRTYDNVELVARKRATLTRVSAELFNDSAINIADDIARNIAWSFAKDIDQAGTIGDGTSTYFGVVGITQALKDLSGTVANIAGLVEGAGNAYSELTLANFEDVAGRLPTFEGAMGEPAWMVHPRFYRGVMVKLANASGGVTRAEIEGKPGQVFLGSPVIFNNAMPRTEANSQVCAVYGHFDMGAMLGRVNNSFEVATSDQRYFDSDEIAIRGIHRVAFNAHDVGNADATEANREPGPIVGLITQSS